MPTMPNGLVPLVSALSSEAPEGVTRTEVAGGPARYRLDWARGRQRFNVKLALDGGRLLVWTAFYHHIIKKGAIAFDMRLDSGLGVMPHSVHILPGSYSLAAAGGNYMASFVVECESAVYSLSDAQVAAYGLSATTLPAGMVPTIAAYSFAGPDGVERDQLGGGAAGYALQWARGTQRFNCTFILTATQFAAWSVWFHRLIAKGSRTFNMRLDSGTGPDVHAATIVPGTYSSARTGGTATVVSFIVEAEPTIYEYTAADAQVIIDLHNAYGDTQFALLARLAQFANVDTNVLDFP
ncbi:hypothetical protein [Massilia sp. DWR3-1-1]|uniref:hypothetical protein n=1 Tax=Massilia sp. DWR3-1-1 TaxID=2804559 RepID=UPI003CE68EA1